MKRIYVIVLAILSANAVSIAALAQVAEPAASGGLEEIIVTATKRAENLQDVPVSISALSAADLRSKGVFSTSDLNDSIPNLQVGSAYGETQPNFTLRGIGVGTEYNSNAASPVGVYVDEVYQSFRASHGQQLYDLDQIEIVRGPQGTLFGRNTTGGAINFFTTKPQMGDTSGYATVGYGNYDRFNAEAAVDFTPVTDIWGIRVAGTFLNSQPFVKNVTRAGPANSASAFLTPNVTLANVTRTNTGTSPGGAEVFGIRATSLYKPSSDLAVTLKIYASQSYGGLDSPQNAGTGASPNLPADSVTLLNSGFAGFGANFLPPNWSPSANGLNALRIGNDQEGTALVKAQGVVLNVNYRLNDSMRLISISDFDASHYALLPTIDCDGTPYAVCAIGYDSVSHSVNQDLRFDYSADKTKLIVGAYYGLDNIVSRNTPHFYDFLNDEFLALGNSLVSAGVFTPATNPFTKSYWNPPGIGLLSQTNPAAFPTGLDANQNYTQERRSSAFYTEGSQELTSTVKLTLGARFTHDTFAYKDALTTFYDLTGAARAYTVSDYRDPATGKFAFYYPGVTSGPVHPLNRSDSSNATTGRAIIDWKPLDGILLYGSYSRGYRGGTYNGLAFQGAQQVYFVKPETVDALEAGLKSRFLDNRVQVNLSVFHYNYHNQQQQLLDPSSTTYLVNLSGKETGLDADVQFKVNDVLRLDFGLGIIHSAFNHSPCPAVGILATNPPPQVGNCLSTGAGNVDVGGNPFPYAAKQSGNFGINWKALQWDSGAINVSINTSYTGRYYFDTFGDYSYTSPIGKGPAGGPVDARTIAKGPIHVGGGDYWLLNSRVSYVTGNWTVAAWGKNLTDKLYYGNYINVEGSYGSDYRIRTAPRTFGLEVSMKFGAATHDNVHM